MEQTLVILKPSALQRALAGEVIKRFEQKGLKLAGIKMIQLTDQILNEHYAHLADRPFFQRIKDSMMITPVIVTCWEGKDSVRVVRTMTGSTNSRDAVPGTIRGDFVLDSYQIADTDGRPIRNLIHASGNVDESKAEINLWIGD